MLMKFEALMEERTQFNGSFHVLMLDEGKKKRKPFNNPE